MAPTPLLDRLDALPARVRPGRGSRITTIVSAAVTTAIVLPLVLAKPALVHDGIQALHARFPDLFDRPVWIHRKGATRALPAGHPMLAGTRWQATGHPVLIPGSMGDASFVLRPLPGAARSLYSVNHGCGRRKSRTAARREISQEQADRQMRERGVIRRELDRERNPDRFLQHGDDVEDAVLDRVGGFRWIAGDVVEVQFDRVGAGVLDERRISQPGSRRGAVERCDHGDA